MELPYLKKKQNRGGDTAPVSINRESDATSDQALLERIADELLVAIEKKDIKAFREALSALVLTFHDQD